MVMMIEAIVSPSSMEDKGRWVVFSLAMSLDAQPEACDLGLFDENIPKF